MRTCGKCEETKPLQAFPRNGRRLDGSQRYRPECTICDRIRQRQQRVPNLRGPVPINQPSERVAGFRTCTGCLTEKPDSEFGLGGMRNGVHRRSSKCKGCRNESYNARSAGAPDDSKDRDLWKRYRISLAEYNAMLASQGYECLICRVHESECEKRFCVDHDHSCCPGERTCGSCIRGLLCGPCNRGLGSFLDDASQLRAAAKYLEESKTRLEATK